MDAAVKPQHAVEVPDWYSESLQGNYFTGSWVEAEQHAPAVEVATGNKFGRVGIATPENIRSASEAAASAQAQWAAFPYEERQAIFRSAAAVARQKRDDLIAIIMVESGSVEAKAAFEVDVTIKLLDECSAMPSQSIGQTLPSTPGRLSIARRRPIGVVGVISPFNFPLYLAIRAVAPALALGNAVVLKPDPRTAVCGGFSIAKIFEEAGLPAGLLHVLPGGADAGAALCSAPAVGMIQFTGSTAAGRKVGELAGYHLKKVSLELGGKSSLIVLEDADIDLAVRNTKWASFLHQGQICMAAGRILVHENIADQFLAALTEATSPLPVGDPAGKNVALGPLINSDQCKNAASIVEDAVAKGARILAGGSAEGVYFAPTVLADVGPGMRAFEEEIFAPVAAVTTFGSDEEAISIANDTDYGLAGAVITNSLSRALQFADRLKVGLLHVNDQTVNEEVINPFGGMGHSGNGTSIGGPANWEEFTQWQWLTIKGEAPQYPL